MEDSITTNTANWSSQIVSYTPDTYRIAVTDSGNGYLRITNPTEIKSTTIPCHAKMEGEDRPYLEDYKAKIEMARKLNLQSEVKALGDELLKADIRRLTAGAGYVEVTESDLETMFEFPRLRRKFWWHNLKCSLTVNTDDKIHVRLVKENAERSSVRIPYGAQLRMEEAKEKGLFESIAVIYPNVVTERQLARERDPALVGLYNGSMFLICSWDLPDDLAKMDVDIDALKALKLKG